MKKLINELVLVITLSLGASFPLATMAGEAEDMAALDTKLEQCKIAYAKARDMKASRQDSAQADAKYRKLMQEIMHDLNVQNNAGDSTMSNERLSHSVRVMGQALEMMAQPPKAEWSYLY